MHCFTPLLAVITVARLVSLLRIDVEHHSLATNAQKTEGHPGGSHWGHQPWQPQPHIPGPSDVPDVGRVPGLASPSAVPGRRMALATWAATTLAAARRTRRFAGKGGRQPPGEVITQVWNPDAAKEELDLAKEALGGAAWAASGSTQEGLLGKAFAAVNAAQAAMDSTYLALSTVHGAMDDAQDAVADAAMGVVGASMAKTKAAMDDAQALFESLLRSYDQSEVAAHALGHARMKNGEQFQVSIMAGAEALRKARFQWWHDVGESMVSVVDVVAKQEATYPDMFAFTDKVNESSFAWKGSLQGN